MDPRRIRMLSASPWRVITDRKSCLREAEILRMGLGSPLFVHLSIHLFMHHYLALLCAGYRALTGHDFTGHEGRGMSDTNQPTFKTGFSASMGIMGVV